MKRAKTRGRNVVTPEQKMLQEQKASKAERFISLNITPETLLELVNFGIEGANKEKDLTKSVSLG